MARKVTRKKKHSCPIEVLEKLVLQTQDFWETIMLPELVFIWMQHVYFNKMYGAFEAAFMF